MNVVTAGFAPWNRKIAAAIQAVGQPDFPVRIEEALKAVLDLDIVMIFAYSGAEKPACLYHNIDQTRAATVIDAYIRGPYLLDPFYRAATDPEAVGVRQLRKMAPDHFYNSEYFRQHYGLTKIRDEVGIVCRLHGGAGVVISFTRPLDSPAFGRRDLKIIEDAEPVLRLLIERHWSDARASAKKPAAGQTVDPMNATIGRMTGGVLTPREIEVTSLILRGHSSAAIADALNIAEGTVKIHRKNIHQKLKISSQSELFSMFIFHLSQQ
jgi:DNA-binding CsgD family transcriptional regulator